MENTAAYDVNNAGAGSSDGSSTHPVANKAVPGEHVSGEFSAMLSKAELKFWDTQMESPQAEVQNLAEEITHSLTGLKSLSLSMDQDTQRMVVRVVDKRTGNVVRQLPSSQMVDLVKQMRDLEGLLFKASS